ncbi:MAG: AAA domain-containing protein [Candidatus Bathyarchaeia archaeon]
MEEKASNLDPDKGNLQYSSKNEALAKKHNLLEKSTLETKPITIDASGIAEFIRFDCCLRYFKLRFEGEEESCHKWPEAFKPLSPLLYGAGKELEKEKVQWLKAKAASYLDLSGFNPKTDDWEISWKNTFQTIMGLLECSLSAKTAVEYKPALIYQAPMKGHIGVWDTKGIADLIGIWPIKNGKIKVRIFEIKSSWKEQTAHRIQVAIYVLLLTNHLGDLSSKVDFEGCVINKKSDLEKFDAASLPPFRLEPLIQDVQRLLSTEGELYRIHQIPLSEVAYQISWRCDNCGFNECCIARAIERESVALLNLSRGEQKALKCYGILRLEDLAKLKVVPNLDDQRPYNFKEIPALDLQKVQLLSADPVIGAKLDKLIQRAQFMLYGIRPDSPFANKVRMMPWLTATGYGNLPEDSPQLGADTALSFRPDGMIRVYFHIEWDYMLDILSMISARVSCTRYRGQSISISKIVNTLPDQREECLTEEKNMLEPFFADVTKAINDVASEVGSPDEAPIHLYFYTRRERDLLMDAVRRQPSLMTAHAVQDLLGLRQAIDQPMFSILQDEIVSRKAAGYHSTGLLPVLKQSSFFDANQWVVKRKDGSLLDMRSVFRDGFFNFELPYTRNHSSSVSFILGSEDVRPKEGYYPVRARFGNQIPIEYLWAAKGRLDSTQGKSFLEKFMIEKRMWCDYPHKTRRISDEDLTLLSARLCLALEHIERWLTIRNRRLGKKPIDIPKIPKFTLGQATLERSCREFLDLEYFAKRQELYQHYALLPSQRVATGRSVIFECLSAEETDRDFVVRGKLIYEGLGLPKSECIVNACRVKGADDSGSGDWMVASEIRVNEQGQFEEARQRSPSQVEKSARVIVEKVDLRKMEVTLKVVSWPSGKSRRYSTWHDLPTTDRTEATNSKHMQLFEAGRKYILDDLADDIISERAAKCLDYAADNPLYCLLAGFLAGTNKHSECASLAKVHAKSFLDWVEHTILPPKLEQTRFVERVFGKEQIVMLQGPPGTGKTATLQLAVLAHIAAHRAVGRCRVLMVAPTHKAIHEFVNKLAKSWRTYCKEGGRDLANLKIYRVLNNAVKAVEGVKYVNYNEDSEAVTELKDALSSQDKLVSDSTESFPFVLCVTPPGLYGLMKKIGGSEPAWGEGFFDLLVVDEASMMRLPELILSGAFVNKNAQILVAGDHRQLPPIQKHNWEKEDRRTIEEMASFLSAMDFLRLLRQEDLGIEHVKAKHKADIPTERLSETHRCHKVVAKFLSEWVYHKDGIDLRSDQTQTLPFVSPSTVGLKTVLEPENIFVLIVHDEMESFQSNLVEAKIVDALVRNVKAEGVGVVTPHNAQRGVIKNLLLDGYENVRVDTVERYQGGESDFIIISSTVSDPDYVRSESDFLLNLNRINVAISRMKKKVVIVASRSIFEFMPQDADDYDKALLWRGIAQTVGFTAEANPKWRGSLSDFLGKPAQKVDVEVYAKPSNE